MSTDAHQAAEPRVIVLPFRPAAEASTAEAGLALHFLLGNVLIINSRLREMWFGWRMKQIFPRQEDLLAYLQGGAGPELDPAQLGPEQKIRFWLTGKISGRTAHLTLSDTAEKPGQWTQAIPFEPEDHLIGFRLKFMDWLPACGIPFNEAERRAALWPERLSAAGLNAVGRALEAFYMHSAYGSNDPLDLRPFAAATELCPASFMARNLLGWALYRREEFGPARAAFLKALTENPAGAGAMSGLMWCAVMSGDRQEALYWAARKAELRREDIEEAKQKAARLLQKHGKP